MRKEMSLRAVTRGRTQVPKDRRSRLPLIAAAAFVPPVTEIISVESGRPIDDVAIAGLSIALLALIALRMRVLLSRLIGQARELETALSERGILEADLR